MMQFTEEQRKAHESKIHLMEEMIKYAAKQLDIYKRRCESTEATIKEQDELLRQYQETIGRLSRDSNAIAQALPEQGSDAVNDAAWLLHDLLAEGGPLTGFQFNNLKGSFYEAMKVALGISVPEKPQ